MPALVCVAVLAHDHRESLDDLIDNIRWFVPGADVLVFNGGANTELLQGVDAEVCPASRPLRIGNLVPFHWETIRWLHERRRPYDFLVTLDSDMLFVRHGYTDFLERTMAESEFMGMSYLVAGPWYPGWDTVRWFNLSWRRWWQPLFGTRYGSWALNPGMVFRREYCEKLLSFPKRESVLRRARLSRLYGIEEFVWASFATAMRCRPVRNPGSHGVIVPVHAPATFRAAIEDPDVFLVHKIPMALDHPHRRIVKALRENREPDWSLIGSPVPRPAGPPRGNGPGVAGRTNRTKVSANSRTRLTTWMKDRYFQLLP